MVCVFAQCTRSLRHDYARRQNINYTFRLVLPLSPPSPPTFIYVFSVRSDSEFDITSCVLRSSLPTPFMALIFADAILNFN